MRDSDEIRQARKALGIQEFHERQDRKRTAAITRATRELAEINSIMRTNGVGLHTQRPPRFAQPTSAPVHGAHRVWKNQGAVKFTGPKWPEYAERGVRPTTRIPFNTPVGTKK